jgi:8-oxo-dGTP diphosphatase
MELKRKAFVYITHRHRLLVFSHPDFPEAGIQVPAGTLREGEEPVDGAVREAREETGLANLRLVSFLGCCDYPVPEWNQLHRRYFFHLACDEPPGERWQHWETDPSQGTARPICFEFFWADLPDGLPALQPGHGGMLPALLAGLGLSSPPAPATGAGPAGSENRPAG